MKSENKKTVYDLAAAAGVSPATVSRVMNHPGQVTASTRSKVEQAMRDLGYVPDADAQVRRGGRPDVPEKPKSTFPLLLLNIPSASNPFYSDVIRGAQAAADRNGCHLLVNYKSLNSMNIASLINLIQDFGVAGLVVCDTISKPVLDALLEIVPVVQCSEYNPDSIAPYVSIDNIGASKKAVEYMLSAGRRRVAFFSTQLCSLYAHQRQLGYLNALSAAGIPLRKEWMLYVSEVDFDMAFQAARGLLQAAPIPDSVFAVSDVLASAVIKAALETGLSVPQDLCVVGFDNVDISLTTTPTITTVGQPRHQLGQRAVEMLIRKVMGISPSTHHVLLNTELIIRESSML